MRGNLDSCPAIYRNNYNFYQAIAKRSFSSVNQDRKPSHIWQKEMSDGFESQRGASSPSQCVAVPLSRALSQRGHRSFVIRGEQNGMGMEVGSGKKGIVTIGMTKEMSAPSPFSCIIVMSS